MISYLSTIGRLRSNLRLYFTCSTAITEGVIRLLHELHSALKRVPHRVLILFLHFYMSLNSKLNVYITLKKLLVWIYK